MRGDRGDITPEEYTAALESEIDALVARIEVLEAAMAVTQNRLKDLGGQVASLMSSRR